MPVVRAIMAPKEGPAMEDILALLVTWETPGHLESRCKQLVQLV